MTGVHHVHGRPLGGDFEGSERVHFGMGCFWGVERLFWQQPGVLTTAAGYAGGDAPDPSYREVCSGRTGHAEVVLVVYDPAVIGFEALHHVIVYPGMGDELYRVLKPGGRFAVSDVITRAGLPDAVKANMALWTGCVAGALEEQEFIDLLREVGFEDPGIEPTRVYTRQDAATLLEGTGLDMSLADQVQGKIISGFVRATKPGTPAPRSEGVTEPRRELATSGTRAAAAPDAPKQGSRACGCADDCCS